MSELTFTVNVTLVPRDIDAGPTVAVDVHGAAAAVAEGRTAGRNKPNEATTVAKAAARAPEDTTVVRRRDVTDTRQRKGALRGFSLRVGGAPNVRAAGEWCPVLST